jgi:hypothetical protein
MLSGTQVSGLHPLIRLTAHLEVQPTKLTI